MDITVEARDIINKLISNNIKVNGISGDIPNSSVTYGDEVIVFNKLNPNFCFSDKFKIYINSDLKTLPIGIYTWILLYIKDKLYFIATRVFNHLEFCSKHSYLVYKFNKIIYENEMSDFYILLAGELENEQIGIFYNFMSGTYMLDIKFTNDDEKKIISFINKLFNEIGPVFYDHNLETIIKKESKEDIINFLNDMKDEVEFKIYKKEIYDKLIKLRKYKIQISTLIEQNKKIKDNFSNRKLTYENKLENEKNNIKKEELLTYITLSSNQLNKIEKTIKDKELELEKINEEFEKLKQEYIYSSPSS